ncbi:putative disease resistance protein RGA1 [Silene latifolia]|uniref:putative disease resistance protein RGA1 n=1 Tax=Silene latifolia TaxID=37657 RepID=UPI003D77FD4C
MFGYESQLDDLKLTVSTIKCVLIDAESKHQELGHGGREYIERLKEAVYDVDDLLDEFNTMVQKNKLIKGSKSSKKVRRFFSRSNQVLVAFNMSREIKNLRSKLDKIAKDRQQFGFTDVYVPIKRKPETMSFVGEDTIIGREDDREAIVKMLLGDSDSESSNVVGHKVSYVTVVGIGGLGKTALAQLVYSDSRVEKAFELKMWVCVSDDFILEKIFRQMLGRDVFNIEDLQRQVRNMIEGKRYLLVLDDVWSESRDEWDKLKSFLDLGNMGSRVVVTSRSKKVAKVVAHDLMYELKGLSKENSWNLFKRLAFEQGKKPMDSTHHLFDIGKEIVKKCADVPLAIRVAASMLYDQDEKKWMSLKNVANLMEMGPGQNGVMPILKYSYYHLTPALKSCFSYCALFPKDWRLDKESLVRLWVAHGCLDQPSGYQNEEDVGDEYFSMLLQRCFLQDVKRDRYGEIYECKMHDLIHDLAQEVAGKETILLDSFQGHLSRRNIHLSFTTDVHALLTSIITELGETYTLRTFLNLGYNLQLSESNVIAICSHLRRLRVLDLRYSSISTLPDTMGNLSHLRNLNLSDNDALRVLPNSITKLYNLQVLNVDRTSVSELPLDMRKLVNLRHLSLRGCSCLRHMPPGLDTLTSLHTLTTFVVGKEVPDEGNIGKLKDLNALVNLRGKLNIVFNSYSTFDMANYRNVELLNAAHLKNLIIQFSDQGAIDESLLACLKPHSKLTRIKIENYDGFKLPSWAKSLASSLPNLVQINLTNFDGIEILPSLSRLRHLKCLEVLGMPNVEFMESEVVVGPGYDELLFYPSLEKLVLCKFPKLKGWWSEEINWGTGKVGSPPAVVPSFPSLRELCLYDCPSLRSLPSCSKLCNLNLHKYHGTLTFLENKRAVPGDSTRGSSSSLSSGFPLLYMESVRTDDTRALDCLFEKYPEGIQYLGIQNFEGESLSTLAEKCIEHAPYIKHLGIWDCPNLMSLSGEVRHITSLQILTIGRCKNLELENNNEEAATATTSWESLHLLSQLSFYSLTKLINLPKELQYLTSLQLLRIEECENLEALPEWINNLTSLITLHIIRCDKLKSLPEAIAHMPALETLGIYGCENLTRRCRQPDGEDWPKLRHIPHLIVR